MKIHTLALHILFITLFIAGLSACGNSSSGGGVAPGGGPAATGLRASSPAGIYQVPDVLGAATVVGTLSGAFIVDDIAFDPNSNTLYGADYDTKELIAINTTTGASTSIGALGFTDIRGLAYDPNSNTLYGTDHTTNQLIVINTTSGRAPPSVPWAL